MSVRKRIHHSSKWTRIYGKRETKLGVLQTEAGGWDGMKNIKCRSCFFYRNEWCEKIVDSPDPEEVRDCAYFREMTNADKIRSMSDEELALWICGVYDIEEEHGKFINGIIIPGYATILLKILLYFPRNFIIS